VGLSYWAVVQTESSREHVAAEQLVRCGFEVYLPRIRERRGRIIRIAPLFPCYLFCRIVDRWHTIDTTIAVLHVLRFGEHPSRLRDGVVEELQARERGGLIKLPKRFKVGDPVRILRGTFRDFVGLYDGASGEERARVLLEMLGRKVAVELAECDIVGAVS
jgi:transcriptional antiterminator RfaH